MKVDVDRNDFWIEGFSFFLFLVRNTISSVISGRGHINVRNRLWGTGKQKEC